MEAQAHAIRSWAKREGLEIVATFEEEVSGGASLEKRPVLLQAIAALGVHGAGQLVVQRLDRFSRDPLTAAMAELEAQKFGAKIVSADGNGNGDDPGSRLMRDVGLAAARFERAMIAARTKAALAVKRARGESTGTPPYGYRVGDDGKALVPDEGEQATLARLRGWRARGWPYRQVREEATRLGLLGRTGQPFTLQAVFEMARTQAPASTLASPHRALPSGRRGSSLPTLRGDHSCITSVTRSAFSLSPVRACASASGLSQYVVDVSPWSPSRTTLK